MFARAVITNHHGVTSQTFSFLTALEARSEDIGRLGFFWGFFLWLSHFALSPCPLLLLLHTTPSFPDLVCAVIVLLFHIHRHMHLPCQSSQRCEDLAYFKCKAVILSFVDLLYYYSVKYFVYFCSDFCYYLLSTKMCLYFL